MSKLRLSWTSMSAFLHCPRKYWLQYERGINPDITEDSKALILGSYVHAAFEGAFWGRHLGTADTLQDIISIGLSRMRAYAQESRIVNKLIWDDDLGMAVPDQNYYSMLDEIWDYAREVFEFQAWKFDWDRYEVMTLRRLFPENALKIWGMSESLEGIDEPLLEWKFAVPYLDATISGVLDAVLYDLQIGEPVVMDFKVRASMGDFDSIMLDGQLPLYAALVNAMQLEPVLNRVVQYQMANVAPAVAKLTPATKKLSTASLKTTWEVWSNSVRAMGLDPEQYREQMMPKMNPETDFTNPVDIPVGGMVDRRTEENLDDIVMALNRARETDCFPAILSSARNGCSFCPFKPLCSLYQAGGDVDTLIQTKYIVRAAYQSEN